MTSKKETFSALLESFTYRYDLHTVFEDFLTMSLCAVTKNYATGKSHYEELYMEAIAPYANDELRFRFPKMFATLVAEMEERTGSSLGNDVLGDYYERNLPKKGKSQFFTPWPVCQFMAKSSIEHTERSDNRPLRILEPACGSGRLLLAAAREAGPSNEFYGIDLDHTCVKMTALNLFLNGMFRSEVMCADALLPDDFQVSYVISLVPIGIFRIDKKEDSRLWHLMRSALAANKKERAEKKKPAADIKLSSQSSENDFGTRFRRSHCFESKAQQRCWAFSLQITVYPFMDISPALPMAATFPTLCLNNFLSQKNKRKWKQQLRKLVCTKTYTRSSMTRSLNYWTKVSSPGAWPGLAGYRAISLAGNRTGTSTYCCSPAWATSTTYSSGKSR